MSFELLEHTEVMDFSFNDIVDDEFDFYGVDTGSFKIDDFVLIPLEDPYDGYRSYLSGGVLSLQPEKFIYPSVPLDHVRLEWTEIGDFAGYQLTSTKDGHIWLRFGTEHYNDYYPYTVFAYNPRTGKEHGYRMMTAEDFSE